jgi:hypothetical protein
MKFPLGAMTVGDILDRGLKLLFARLPAFYLINLIVLSPMILLQIAGPLVIGNFQALDPAAVAGSVAVGLGALLLALVLQPIGTAAILYIVMEEYAGRRATVSQAFSFAFTRFLSLVGASILVGLIVFVGTLLCCLPGIYFAITYSFVSQVVVLERLGAGDALKRSQTLVQGYWWRVFGVLCLIGVANAMVEVAVAQGLQFVLPSQELIPADEGPRIDINPVNHAIATLVAQLVNILFKTFMAVCTTLLYLDLRIRKEGFDLELAAQLGEEPSDRDRSDDRDRYDDRDKYDADRGRYDDDRYDDDQYDDRKRGLDR